MNNIKFNEYARNPILKEASGLSDDYIKLSKLSLQIQKDHEGFLFCGRYRDDDEYRLFLYEADSPVELITLFRVGSHNSPRLEMEELMAEKVRIFMDAIYQKYPFYSYFIDQAGFACRFYKEIDRTSAIEMSSYIVETGGYAMMIEYQGDKNFTHNPIAGSLYEDQEIYLWWD